MHCYLGSCVNDKNCVLKGGIIHSSPGIRTRIVRSLDGRPTHEPIRSIILVFLPKPHEGALFCSINIGWNKWIFQVNHLNLFDMLSLLCLQRERERAREREKKKLSRTYTMFKTAQTNKNLTKQSKNCIGNVMGKYRSL